MGKDACKDPFTDGYGSPQEGVNGIFRKLITAHGPRPACGPVLRYGCSESPWRARGMCAALVGYGYCVPYFVPSYEVEYKTVNADIGAYRRKSFLMPVDHVSLGMVTVAGDCPEDDFSSPLNVVYACGTHCN